MRCVYCGEEGRRWSVDTNGFHAPAVLCPAHEAPLREIAESMEGAARRASASGEGMSGGGVAVIEDPDEMIRRLESEQ